MAGVIRAYCISCGMEVETKRVTTSLGGQEFLQCIHCDSFLGTADSPQSLSAPAYKPPGGLKEEFKAQSPLTEDLSAAGGDALSADLTDLKFISPDELINPAVTERQPVSAPPARADQPSPAAEPPLEIVMVADDSGLLREIMTDMLVEKGLSRKVLSSKNGYEFIVNYVKTRLDNNPVGLVIMDVNMPVLNGISAAVAMRAHEKGRGIEPVPILFFTVKICDDTFKKVLSHCRPAMYINKGASYSPEQLQDRINKLINQLLAEVW